MSDTFPEVPLRRFGFVFAAIVVASMMMAASAEADVIQCLGDPVDPGCEIIGEFAWSREDLGLGLLDDIFQVTNLTDSTPTLPAGDFSSLNVVVDPDPGLSGAFVQDPLPAGPVPTEAVELFSGVTSAQLTFLYQGTLFTVSLFESELVPDPGGVSFFAREIYAQNVVPEPSSLLLLMSGLALSIARARARR